MNSGKGLRVVVNAHAGPALSSSPTDQLREALPDADIIELGPDEDLQRLLRDPDALSIGAAGGDGTLSAAAAVALETDKIFVAVPNGTLNHFARDVGLESVDDAIEAMQSGCEVAIDVGSIGDRVFLNTFSFGGYSEVVDRRERWEGRIGKWPALLVALAIELPRMRPLRLEIDGHLQKVWQGWVGNCEYSPIGLAPRYREAMDDGLLDIRIVNGARRFSRLRFTFAALTGRLAHCSVYREWTAEQLEVVNLDGPLRLAADGETFDGGARIVVSKKRRALRLLVPRPDSAPDR